MKKLVLALLFMNSVHSMAQQKTFASKPMAWPNAVSYEIFVRSFADSNGDGIGDLNGITSKLPYLKNLGIEAIWLTPICPSPTYHKYDVTNYKAIDPEYGTMDDFKKLVSEAHKLNIKVIPDLVPNHSSSQHPWFLEAKKGPDNPYRDYYVWSNPKNLKDSINWYYPKDENKKNIGDEKYYAFFWSGMPDLNYDNPKVREEMIDIAKFWLQETGVDGFRLDAAQHIYDEKEVKKNVAWWQEFRAALEPVKKDVYLMGEVWNKDTVVAKYLNKALSGCFNFDLSFALQDASKSEQAKDLVDKVIRIRKLYSKNNPAFVDATILSNHDQNRIMDDLNYNQNQAKMAAALLLTLPGSPYIYYGEELAMRGQKPDENIREPFIWDKGANDKSQTTWMKPKYSNDKTVVPQKIQEADPNSFLIYYTSLLQFRAKNDLMRNGEISKSAIKDGSLCAFFRSDVKDSVLVVHNLCSKEITFDLPENEAAFEKEIFNSATNYKRTKNKISLSAYSTVVLGKK